MKDPGVRFLVSVLQKNMLRLIFYSVTISVFYHTRLLAGEGNLPCLQIAKGSPVGNILKRSCSCCQCQRIICQSNQRSKELQSQEARKHFEKRAAEG